MANDLERRLAQAERALREALERQAASDEVLRVIASSPGELGPVFQAMLENAIRVCDAKFGTLFHCDGELLQLVAEVGTPRAFGEFLRQRGRALPQPGSLNDRVFRTRQVIHSPDYAAELNRGTAATLGGARSTLPCRC